VRRELVVPGAVIAAIVALAIFAYATWYNVPELTYELLPAYPVSDTEQVVALIVRNEGAASATDVRIVVSGKGNATVLPTAIPQEHSIAGEDGRIIVTMPQLPPGDKISFYVRIYTSDSDPVASIYVSSLEGLGKERPPAMTPSSWRDSVNFFVPTMTFIVFLYILAGLVDRVKRQGTVRKATGEGASQSSSAEPSQ
jgi:hypothetical protein